MGSRTHSEVVLAELAYEDNIILSLMENTIKAAKHRLLKVESAAQSIGLFLNAAKKSLRRLT